MQFFLFQTGEILVFVATLKSFSLEDFTKVFFSTFWFNFIIILVDLIVHKVDYVLFFINIV